MRRQERGGWDDPGWEDESRRLGCLAYLRKPSDAADILILLNSLPG